MSDELIFRIRQRAENASTRIDNGHTIPEIFPPATDDQLRTTEKILGFSLPPLLVDVYRQIGNGGFGPGYGLYGVVGGYKDDGHGLGAVELYKAMRTPNPNDETWQWPERVLPICHWGCCIYTCVYCSDGSETIYTCEPGARKAGQSMNNAFAETHGSVSLWLADWVAGVRLWDEMYEDDTSELRSWKNPFTGEETTRPPRQRLKGEQPKF